MKYLLYVILTVSFFVFSFNTHSKLAYRLTSDVVYLYLAGLLRPDFRTINRFRQEHLGLLQGLFVPIVRRS